MAASEREERDIAAPVFSKRQPCGRKGCEFYSHSDSKGGFCSSCSRIYESQQQVPRCSEEQRATIAAILPLHVEQLRPLLLQLAYPHHFDLGQPLRAVFLGPPLSPWSDHLFEVALVIPADYPQTGPRWIQFYTTAPHINLLVNQSNCHGPYEMDLHPLHVEEGQEKYAKKWRQPEHRNLVTIFEFVFQVLADPDNNQYVQAEEGAIRRAFSNRESLMSEEQPGGRGCGHWPPCYQPSPSAASPEVYSLPERFENLLRCCARPTPLQQLQRAIRVQQGAFPSGVVSQLTTEPPWFSVWDHFCYAQAFHVTTFTSSGVFSSYFWEYDDEVVQARLVGTWKKVLHPVACSLQQLCYQTIFSAATLPPQQLQGLMASSMIPSHWLYPLMNWYRAHHANVQAEPGLIYCQCRYFTTSSDGQLLGPCPPTPFPLSDFYYNVHRQDPYRQPPFSALPSYNNGKWLFSHKWYPTSTRRHGN